MNSFFASIEQHDRSELRGRPVAVAAVDVDSTCCIAASHEARQLGIRTGTSVKLARQAGVHIVEARPPRYVQVHHQIRQAVETCIPVDRVLSIDEMFCRLDQRHRDPSTAIDLAHRVKQSIYKKLSPYLRCSIGLAPNAFLAKTAADMQKPDGLTVLTEKDLPQALYPLQLDDLAGIGPRMLRRVNAAGIHSIEQLYQLSEMEMKQLWGGIVGQRWWHLLRGEDLPESPTHRSSVGHSHVLPPELRTMQGAHAVLIRLIHKAAARLRRIDHWAGRLSVYVSFTYREEGWNGSVALGMCQDTLTMVQAFNDLWRWPPPGKRPTQVAVTLHELTSSHSASAPLFSGEANRVNLSRTLDRLNAKFGPDTVYFGGMHGMKKTAPTRIAFSQVPEI